MLMCARHINPLTFFESKILTVSTKWSFINREKNRQNKIEQAMQLARRKDRIEKSNASFIKFATTHDFIETFQENFNTPIISIIIHFSVAQLFNFHINFLLHRPLYYSYRERRLS